VSEAWADPQVSGPGAEITTSAARAITNAGHH